ncbi:hypothetical protein MJI37_32580, partial [Salmonella enterica subsp. enterica serovar Cerro]|nr:hypothetical protein [Salmonella enterica subsp. enterica serovar Cerro]
GSGVESEMGRQGCMINVVSFSGGRTSAYLLWLMEQKRRAGEDFYNDRYIIYKDVIFHVNRIDLFF